MVPNIANYIKNLGKSIAFSTMDHIKEHNEATSSFVETNQELFTDVYTTIKDYKVTFKRIGDQIKRSKIYDAAEAGIDATFDSIKTGEFYSKKREDYYTNKALGSSGSFSDDEWDLDSGGDDLADFGFDDDDDLDISDGDRYLAEETDKTAKVAAGAISETIAESAKYTVQSQRIGTNMLYSQSIITNKTLASGFEQLHGSMQSIANAQLEAMKIADSNNQKFYERKLKLDEDRNEILAKILDIQQRSSGIYDAKKKEKEDLSFGAIADATGMPDIRKYFKAVKKNISSQAGMFSSMMDLMGDDSNILLTFVANPLKFIPDMISKYMIPKAFDDAMKSFDKTASGFFGSMIARMNAAAKDDSNPVLQMLGKIFGINNNTKETLDTSNYQKGAVPFDGITRKSIVEVIPFYLRQIAAGVTGQPEAIYDYDTGKFVSSKSLIGKYKDLKNSSVKSATSDIRAEVNKTIKDGKARFASVEEENKFYEDMEKIYTGVYNDQGRLDTKANRTDLANKYGVNENNLRLFLDAIWPTLDRGVKMNMAGNIMRARQSHKDSMIKRETDGYSIFNQIFNDSKNFATESYTEEGTVKKDSKKSILLTVTDNHGRNIFYYLQETVKELMWQRLNWGQQSGPSNTIAPIGRGRNRIQSALERSRGTAGISIEDISITTLRSKEEKKLANTKNSQRERFEKKVQELMDKYPDGLDLTQLSSGEKQVFSEIKSKIELNNAVELRKDLGEGKFERLSSWYDNLNIYGSGEDNKQKWNDINKMVEETDNFFDQMKNAKSIRDKMAVLKINSSKIKNNGLEFITGAIGRADEALYKMVFGDDKEINEDAPSFLEALTGKIESTFERLNTWLDDRFDDLKTKLGVDNLIDIPKKFIKNFFGIDVDEITKNAGEKFRDFMKPLGESIKETAGSMFETVKDSLDGVADSVGLNSWLDKQAAKKAEAERKANEEEYSNIFSDDNLASNYGITAQGKITSVTLAKKAMNDPIIRQIIYGTRPIGDLELITGLSGNNKLTRDARNILEDYINQTKKSNRKDVMSNLLSVWGPNAQKQEIVSRDEAYAVELTKRQKEKEEKEKAEKEKTATNALAIVNKLNKTGKVRSVAEVVESINQRTLVNDPYQYGLAGELIKAPTTTTNAKGTPFVEESGFTAISKGEMIIPANLNPFNPDRDKVDIDKQERDEQALINAAKRGKISKRAAGTNNVGRDTISPGFGEAMIQILMGGAKSVKNGLFAGNAAKDDDAFDKNLNMAKDVIKPHLASMAGGGILGGILAGVTGLFGGPLLGAAVGAGVNLARKSNTVQEMLFGRVVGYDNNNKEIRNGQGLISNNIQKVLPDLKKFGIAGTIAGLITPLGPIGGLLVGSGIAFAKQNTELMEAIFGKKGKDDSGLLSKNRREWLKDRLPHAALGALGGALLGPFGLPGNLIMGSALGFVSATEEFKRFMFGRERTGYDGKKVRDGGAVGILREIFVTPITDYVKGVIEKSNDWFKNDIIGPVKEGLPWIGKWLKIKLEDGIDRIGNFITKSFDKVLMNPIAIFVKEKMLSPLTKFFGGIFKTIAPLVPNILSLPSKGIGLLGRKAQNSLIKSGNTEGSMTAAEILQTAKDRNIKISNKDRNLYRAVAGASTEELTQLSGSMRAVLDSDTTLDTRVKRKDLSAGIIESLSNDQFDKKDKRALVKLLKNASFVDDTKGGGFMDAKSAQKLNSLIDNNDMLSPEQKEQYKLNLKQDWAKMQGTMKQGKDFANTKEKITTAYSKLGIDIDWTNPRDVERKLKMIDHDIANRKLNNIESPEVDLAAPQEKANELLGNLNDVNNTILEEFQSIVKYGIKIDKRTDQERAKSIHKSRMDKVHEEALKENEMFDIHTQALKENEAFDEELRDKANGIGSLTNLPTDPKEFAKWLKNSRSNISSNIEQYPKNVAFAVSGTNKYFSSEKEAKAYIRNNKLKGKAKISRISGAKLQNYMMSKEISNIDLVSDNDHNDKVSEAAGLGEVDKNSETITVDAGNGNGLLQYDKDTKGEFYLKNTPGNKEVMDKVNSDKDVQKGMLGKLGGLGSNLKELVGGFFTKNEATKKKEPWWKSLFGGATGIVGGIVKGVGSAVGGAVSGIAGGLGAGPFTGILGKVAGIATSIGIVALGINAIYKFFAHRDLIPDIAEAIGYDGPNPNDSDTSKTTSNTDDNRSLSSKLLGSLTTRSSEELENDEPLLQQLIKQPNFVINDVGGAGVGGTALRTGARIAAEQLRTGRTLSELLSKHKLLNTIPGLKQYTKGIGLLVNAPSKVAQGVQSVASDAGIVLKNAVGGTSKSIFDGLGSKFRSGAIHSAENATILARAGEVGGKGGAIKLGAAAAEAVENNKAALFNKISDVFMSIADRIPAKANNGVKEFIRAVSEEIATKNAAKAGTEAIGGKAIKAILGKVFIWADVIAGFTSGYQEASTIFGLIDGACTTNDQGMPTSEVVQISTGIRILAGIIRAMNNVVTFGLVPESWLVTIGLKFIGNFLFNVSELEKMRKISKEALNQYNNTNGTDYSLKEYNYNVLNERSIFKKAAQAVKTGFNKVFGKAKSPKIGTGLISSSLIQPQTDGSIQLAGPIANNNQNNGLLPQASLISPLIANGLMQQPQGKGKVSRNAGVEKSYYQNDPRYANIPYQVPGDTKKQTIGDSGCGPVAAANLLSRITGENASVEDAARFAMSRGFKSINTGTDPKFFAAYLQSHGADAKYYLDSKQIMNQLRSGNPTILMGRDDLNNGSTPFGKHSHYVIATSIDKYGNILIDDPESKRASQKYNLRKVLSKSSLGISGYTKYLGTSVSRKGIGGADTDVLSRDYTMQDLGKWTPVSAEDLNGVIRAMSRKDGTFFGMGATFVRAAQQSGLDPRYILAHAALETGWGTAPIYLKKHNAFGIQAYDASPMESAKTFASGTDGIIEGAKWIKKRYYDKGHTTLRKMKAAGYATSDTWQYSIASIMKNINKRLANGDFVAEEGGVSVSSTGTQKEGFWAGFMRHIGNIGKAIYGDLFGELFGSTNANAAESSDNTQSIEVANSTGSADQFFKQYMGLNQTAPYHESRTRANGSKYLHSGIDYSGSNVGGKPIYSPIDGTVYQNTPTSGSGGYGNLLKVKDPLGNIHFFAHMKSQSPLAVGSRVKRGDELGKIGNTGNSTGNHLHYEIRKYSDDPTATGYYQTDPNAYFAEHGLGKNTDVNKSPMIDPNKRRMSYYEQRSIGGADNTKNDVLIKLVAAIVEILTTIAGNTDKLSQIVELLTKVTGAKVDQNALNNSQNNSKAVANTLLKALGAPTSNGYSQIVDKSNDDRLMETSKYLIESMRSIAAS